MHIAFCAFLQLQSARGVWRQRWTGVLSPPTAGVAICTGRVEAKSLPVLLGSTKRRCNLHGACGGKAIQRSINKMNEVLQSARGVWRQRNPARRSTQAAPALQSARDVWRQRSRPSSTHSSPRRCNLHGACGGKDEVLVLCCLRRGCNLHGACGGKERGSQGRGRRRELQSARGVWRQRSV